MKKSQSNNGGAPAKSPRLIIFFVTWMKEYKGESKDPDFIYGEINNFLVHDDDTCYGFGMTSKDFSGVDLKRITSSNDYKKGDKGGSADNIHVFFIAPNPNENNRRCLVGYYKNATVYHKCYLKDKSEWPLGYLCKVKKENAVLFAENERIPIPRELIKNVGRTRFMYADADVDADARPHLSDWLIEQLDSYQLDQVQDLNAVKNDKTVKDETERGRLMQARLGQGKFRQDLIALYKHCILTGITTLDLLIASHIKPWRQSNNQERLDKHNGLLLASHIDRLFDKGYISFDKNGNLLISPQLPLEDQQKLGIKKEMSIQVSDQTMKYMAAHREHIYKDN